MSLPMSLFPPHETAPHLLLRVHSPLCHPARLRKPRHCHSNHFGSKRRKRQKRERESAGSSDPALKTIHFTRHEAAKANVLKVNVETSQLPRTKKGWIGKLQAQDGSEAPDVGPQTDPLPTGLGPHSYTQEDIDRLTGETGFSYVCWLGEITIPVIDSHKTVFALLGGMPQDLVGWKVATDGAADMMSRLSADGHFTDEDAHHRRAHPETPYPSVSRGVSHGGGQTQPGELCNHPANVKITDEMMAHIFFRRIVGFTNCLARVFAPILCVFFASQMARLAAWNPRLNWPFAGSIFAACTFNFGPRASTCPHLDFGNLAWGWCAITALGQFDADRGGHLILWDLKLVIRFPAGSTIFIPSAILRHSNIPVQPHERRFSFTQYSAGGLFRWIRNGFQTDESFEQTATDLEKQQRAEDESTRWEDGLSMFSKLRDL
ncbi:hypothetical protein MSAN_01224100 [Mycena sanguinolenta]|uniref:Uncharacterized protein n=1 Tax=Mycena sanguinolenta TaxID=230812 RepID=A0A8H7D4A0_9AGAR|nr:hypothetical protein MSAN_01224100 [Mycena sanguinolenta]